MASHKRRIDEHSNRLRYQFTVIPTLFLTLFLITSTSSGFFSSTIVVGGFTVFFLFQQTFFSFSSLCFSVQCLRIAWNLLYGCFVCVSAIRMALEMDFRNPQMARSFKHSMQTIAMWSLEWTQTTENKSAEPEEKENKTEEVAAEDHTTNCTIEWFIWVASTSFVDLSDNVQICFLKRPQSTCLWWLQQNGKQNAY